MKKKEWVTPNRMKFESLHKTFNRQVSMISTGNQIGNTVYSSYIRSYNETECNGRTFPKGHLQEYDLGWLVKEAPQETKDFIRRHGKDRKFILYVFFHRSNGKIFWNRSYEEKIIHGAVITDPEHNYIKTFYSRNNVKSRSVIDEAKKYITN